MLRQHGVTFHENSEKSQEFVGRDLKSLSSSYTRSYGFVPERGVGVELFDVDGEKYLDLAGGIAVMSTGYSHPTIVKVIQEQVAKYVHIGGTDFFPTAQIELAEMLQQLIPINGAERPSDKRVYIPSTGSGATEAALKLARYQPNRDAVIAFYGAFHGRSYGSLSLTASKSIQRAKFPHIPSGVYHLPYPGKHSYDNSDNKQSIEFHPVEFIKKYIFKKVSPDEIAAVFVEPIQGEGGYIVPVDHFLPSLRQFCDEYGILLIVDEIQSGIGRTGTWTATEHWDIKPDIVTLAKGLGSGYQIGAVVAHENIMNWVSGAHASTFSGHELSSRAAIATLQVLQEENLLENVQEVGAFAFEELNKLQAEFPVIQRVDGMGLMLGIEFENGKLRDSVVEHCFTRNVITLGAGTSTLRLAPPLIITKEQIAQGIDVIRQSIIAALADEAAAVMIK